ncbi:MAG: hypothetical protein WBH01_04645 [Dehalococcoidia bacterium]
MVRTPGRGKIVFRITSYKTLISGGHEPRPYDASPIVARLAKPAEAISCAVGLPRFARNDAGSLGGDKPRPYMIELWRRCPIHDLCSGGVHFRLAGGYDPGGDKPRPYIVELR